jgi:outer membrane protein OmpA-like peptidoglycan-associated protein
LRIAALLIALFLQAPATSHAGWFWSKKKDEKKVEAPVQTVYEIQSKSYVNKYGVIVSDLPHTEKFVMCSTCPSGVALERDMTAPNIALRFSGQPTPPEQDGDDDNGGWVNQNHEETTPQEQPKRPPTLDSALPKAPDQPAQQVLEKAPPTLAEDPKPQVEKAVKNPESCVDPIYFDFNKSEVREQELAKIKAAAGTLKLSKDLEVHGYTCEIGTKEYNNALAMRRANAVAGILRDMGIEPVVVDGEGKCCFKSESHRDPKDRRVEVICVKL